MSIDDDPDDVRSTTETPPDELVDLVDQRIEAKLEETKAGTSLSRRAMLGALGLGGAAAVGGTAGAATSSSGAAGSMSVGAVTANTYKIADPIYFGGPASARTELNSVLTSEDAGAEYRAPDTWERFYWDGSKWDKASGNFDSVTTEELSIGSSGYSANSRPAISNEDKVVTVPGDYSTVQAAVNDCPMYLRHEYKIDISDGTYNEDVVVPPVIAGDFNGQADQEFGRLEIYGNTGDRTAVELDSFVATGCGGAVNPFITHITFLADNPHDNESTSVAIYGCNQSAVASLGFGANVTNGVLAYGSEVVVNDLNLGSGNLSHAVTTKHGGSAHLKTGTVDGSVTDSLLQPSSGYIQYKSANMNATGTLVEGTGTDGHVWDATDEKFVNMSNLPSVTMPDGDTFVYDGGSSENIQIQNSFGNLLYGDATSGNNLMHIGKSGDVKLYQAGQGVLVQTPDGTDEYRIRVDNSGNVVTDGPL